MHLYYRERCNYYLVRLALPKASLQSELATLLQQSGIAGFCVYALYGHFDFLIRMWATSQKRERFLRLIQDRAEYLEIREFQGHSVRYFWAELDNHAYPNDQSKAEANVVAHMKQIKSLCDSIETGVGFDPSLLTLLERAGIIYSLNFATPDGSNGTGHSYKFYVALSRIPGPTAANQQIEREAVSHILEDLQSNLGVNKISLYEGIGFAEYLVKGVVTDYYRIFDANKAIVEKILAFNLRPETFVVATSDAYESDHIDYDWSEFSGDVLDFERALGPLFAGDIARLTPSVRSALADLFAQYAYLLGTPFETFYKDLFRARIRHDPELLVKALSVTLQIEGYALALFERIWRRAFEDKWVNVVREAGQRIDLKLHGSFVRPTLQEAIAITNHLIQGARLPSNVLTADAGQGWFEKIEKLGPYRNALAHGLVFVDPNYLDEQWEGLADALLGAGEVYNRLHEAFQKRQEGPQPIQAEGSNVP